MGEAIAPDCKTPGYCTSGIYRCAECTIADNERAREKIASLESRLAEVERERDEWEEAAVAASDLASSRMATCPRCGFHAARGHADATSARLARIEAAATSAERDLGAMVDEIEEAAGRGEAGVAERLWLKGARRSLDTLRSALEGGE